jgi:hypothetical protein
MKNIFFFKQLYHDISILDSNNNLIFLAKRDVNWLGSIKTIIENDKIGSIIGTFSNKIFYNTFKIIESTKLNINFVNNKKQLQIEDFLIECKRKDFLGFKTDIIINGNVVCRVSINNILSINNYLKYKLDFEDNFKYFEYVFIYLCLTEDILNS